MLAGAAAAGAGVLLRPPAARAATTSAASAASVDTSAASPATTSAASGRVFTQRIGRLAAGETRMVDAGATFALAAVRWRGAAHPRIELRTRRADGRLGPWAVASGDGHEGDGVRSRDRVGEGIWTGRATALQLRATVDVPDVQLVFVAAEPTESTESTEPTAATGPAADLALPALPLATPTLPAGPGQPPIIARRVWAGEGHPPVKGPFYGEIEMGIVHHTENPNGYSAAEVPALLRAIYAFHVHGRGWFDIGYNYVVDHFGRIWEARQGGIDLPVSGAQAGDWNAISFGVSMLGTYTAVTPSPAALAAVERLLAWKMALSGLPVSGSIAQVVAADGVGWTQFRTGQHVRFPRIAGHRDVDSTSCPGDALYRHLPAMRPRIERLAGDPATLELTGEIDTVAGVAPSLTLSGRLARRSGPSIAQAPIAIQTVVGRVGQTRQLATVTTDSDGRFTVSLTPRESLLVRAVHAAAPAAVSGLIAVKQTAGTTPPVALAVSSRSSASSTARAAAARTPR